MRMFGDLMKEPTCFRCERAKSADHPACLRNVVTVVVIPCLKGIMHVATRVLLTF